MDALEVQSASDGGGSSLPDNPSGSIVDTATTMAQPDRIMTEAESAAMRRHLDDLTDIQHSQLGFATGSVLAIVHFPPNSGTDCNGWPFMPEYKIRIDYEKLVKTGSTKILGMLEPRRQERIRRRLKLQELPEGVEYVVDLTPPSEGAELADLTASLWLPQGTKLWHLAGHYVPDSIIERGPNSPGGEERPLSDKAVGTGLTLGHDDKCRCLREYGPKVTELWVSDGENVPGIWPEVPVPSFRRIPDYCGVRHRVNIIRILRAINGADILINSATRMWTLAHIAVDLDLGSVIRDSVAQWLLATPNSKFIEMFPEDAFKVARALRIPDVLVTSFKILVSEFAVDHAADNPSPGARLVTWTERKRGDYGDMPLDPVEHAGIALHDRIRARFDQLRAGDSLDHLQIPEWNKLLALGAQIRRAQEMDPSPALAELDESYRLLLDGGYMCLASVVDKSLEPSPPPLSQMGRLVEAQRTHRAPKSQLTPLDELQKPFNDYQKALCSFFWINLRTHIGDLFPVSKVRGLTLLAMERRLNVAMENMKEQGVLALAIGDRPAPLDRRTLGTPAFFDLGSFLSQLKYRIRKMCAAAVGNRNGVDGQANPLVLSEHVIEGLEESELRFLPTWAGGCDDESGGTFQDAIPPTEMGPSEPGPAYHTGWTVRTDTDAAMSDAVATDSVVDCDGAEAIGDLGVGELDLGRSSHHSLEVQDSASITTPTRTSGAGSDLFRLSDGEYRDAMYNMPAEHQPEGQTLAAYVEGYGASNFGASSADGSAVSVPDNEEDDFDDMVLSDDDTISAGSVAESGSDFMVI